MMRMGRGVVSTLLHAGFCGLARGRKLNMRYNWETGETDDTEHPQWLEGTIIVHELSGMRLRYVIWCDTATGELERFKLKDGRPELDETLTSLIRVRETTKFRLVFATYTKTSDGDIQEGEKRGPVQC